MHNTCEFGLKQKETSPLICKRCETPESRGVNAAIAYFEFYAIHEWLSYSRVRLPSLQEVRVSFDLFSFDKHGTLCSASAQRAS